jgi:rRNA maturation endonuclease Nob1
MRTIRRCLGCSNGYPADEHACPECGSHAADVEDVQETEDTSKASEAPARPKPRRQRKT